jgi:DnaK suppressor protein
MNNLEIYKTKLETEKKLLEDELSSLGKVDDTGDWEATPDTEINTQDVQDEADMADRSEDYEEKSIKLNALELRLRDTNKALEKIKNNSFGVCEKCGKNIEEDRLEANPAATTCKICVNKVM